MVVLAGANTYSGGTTVTNGATVQVTNSSSIGTGGLTLDNGTIQAGASGLTFNNAVSLTNNGGTFDVFGNALTWNGVIADASGPGALTITDTSPTGGGVVVLAGANTYSGGTTVTNGATVQVTNSSSIGTGGLTLDNGTIQAGASGLTFNNAVLLTNNGGTFDAFGNALTWNGVIADASGPGALTITDTSPTGGGVVVLAGANTYSGGTTVTNGATVQVTNSSSIGTGGLTLDNGTIQAGASGLTFNNAVSLTNNGGTFDVFGNALTWNGVIADASGPGALTITDTSPTGGGVVVLAGANTYSGGTTVTNGATVQVTNSSSIGTGGLTLDNGTIQAGASGLTFNNAVSLTNNGGTFDVFGNALTWNGVIADASGPGALTITDTSPTGGGVVVLAGANTYSGGTTVTNGATVQVTNSSSIGTGGLTLDNGTIQAGASGLTFNNAVSLTNNGGTFDVFGNALTWNGVIADASGPGALTITDTSPTGGGVVVLAGANTYSGGTTVTNGATVQVTNSSSIGTGGLTLDNGTIQAGASGLTFNNAVSLTNNGGTFDAFGNAVTWNGVIADASGPGALTITDTSPTGGGVVVLAGANTYSGGTTVTNGATVQVTNSSSIGTGGLTLDNGTIQAGASGLTFNNAVSLTNNGGTFDAFGNVLTWNGVIADASGPGALTITDTSPTGRGVVVLAGANTYSGGTTVTNGATVQVTNSSSIGTGGLTLDNGTIQAGASGLTFNNAVLLTNKGGTFDVFGNALTWNGVISGSAVLNKQGAGTLILAGANTFVGNTVVLAGTLGVANSAALGPKATNALYLTEGTMLQFKASDLTIANAIVFGSPSGGAGGRGSFRDPTVDTGPFTDRISGVISGSADLTKSGSGALILSGANTYTGGTDVQAGTLDVTGSIASIVTVEQGATLTGTGTFGRIVANSGGTIAPGAVAPFSTLNASTASFASGSYFAVNINPAGQNDKLVTTGATTISGGAVQVTPTDGIYTLSNKYTLITSGGGVSGAFGAVTGLSSLAFVTPVLSYDADDVYLGFAEKIDPPGPPGPGPMPTPTPLFTSVAQTPNQIATATALSTQPTGSPLFNAIIDQTVLGALTAFNALSGEIHASAVGAALDDSRLPREAVLDRLAEAYGAAPSGGGKNVQNYEFSTPAQTFSAWGQAFNSWGHLGGDGNGATVSNNLGGFILGADATLYGRYRLGVAGGYTNASLDVPARASTGNVSATYIGVYGGYGDVTALQLRGGAYYAYNQYGLNRSISFPNFDLAEGSVYGGDALQAFGEAGWRVPVGAPYLAASWAEPFVGVAGVSLRTEAFSETPGPASLVSNSRSYGYGITTLGFRGEASLYASAPLTANAMIGWQHVFGDETPNANLAFASLPFDAFTIAGAPIAGNALALEVGLDWRLTRNLKLGVNYSSLLSSSASLNAVKAKLEANF